MANVSKQPTIGKSTQGTSYPDPSLAGDLGQANNSLGSTAHNWNATNFVEEPEVYNDTPAKKKSYSWNKGGG